jgi:AMIN domain
LSRSRIQLVGLVLLASFVVKASAQDVPPPKKVTPMQDPAVVTSVTVVNDKGATAIEVVSSHQVVPTIQSLDSPPRIVIDLANARMGTLQKRTPVLQQDLLTLRAEQYQKDPPITRIVLDLLVPYAFTWDIAGNRLMVRLKPPEDANAGKKSSPQPPKEMSLVPATEPAVVPVTSGVGDVLLAGSRFAAGSSLSAGSETAVLQLTRGGQVLVCPGTTLSITPSNNAKALMLGLSTGALEMHYTLGDGADTVLTPDFRILFTGPGQFHYAVSADSHGNTCVRGLNGNASSATVSELIGDRVYQVKATEQTVFHSGRIDKVGTDIPLECGCPPPVPVLRTDSSATKVIPEPDLTAKTTLASGSGPSQGAAASSTNEADRKETHEPLSSGPETQPLPPTQPDDVQVQIDAPLVFRGKDKDKDRATATPAPADGAAALPVMDSSAKTTPMQIQVQPPPEPSPEAHPEQHPILHRIKRFFAAIFR